MTISVAPCRDADELRAAMTGIWRSFGAVSPPDDAVANMATLLAPQNMLAAFEEGEIIGGWAPIPCV